MTRLIRDRRGGVSLLAAGAMAVAIGGAAFAVDLASLFTTSRRLQGAVDAAALAAATDLPQARAAADAAVAANGWDRPPALTVTTGRWDWSAPAAARFVATSTGSDATRVTAAIDAPVFFARLFGLRSVRVSRSATAARADLAAFSLGSRLAAVDGGLANQLLGQMTGSTLSLTAMDYEALAAADVDLLTFVRALRTDAAARALSFDRTLAGSVTLPKAFAALGTALGPGSAATAAGKLAAATGAAAALPSLAPLIDLGAIGKQDRAAPGQSVRVNAFDLARGLATLAGGARQVSLDLGATVPGLTRSRVTVAIGERMASSPWLAVTAKGEPVVRTAQTRILVEASVAPSSGLQLLGVTALRLPLYVELAAAEAKLSALDCRRASRSTTLLVRPSIGHAAIAEVQAAAIPDHGAAPAETPARIIELPLVRVTGQSRIDLSGSGWQSVAFDDAAINARAVRTVSSSGTAAAIAGSLVGNLALTATAGPLALPSPTTAALARPLLVAAATPIDGLLAGLTGLLGIHLGQADIRIDGVRCGHATLVA